eukprot:m.217071 g.217071  ORF g.217071 m.217071 type:complete len:52 (+) comp33227_c0_seq1:473-628(+)
MHTRGDYYVLWRYVTVELAFTNAILLLTHEFVFGPVFFLALCGTVVYMFAP